MSHLNHARDLRQWTNHFDKSVNDFIVVIVRQWTNSKHWESSSYIYFILNSWICFCSIIHWSNSKIRALLILLSFNNERINSTKCQWFYRRMHHHVFEYVFVQSFRWSIEKSMHIQYYCFLFIDDHVWCTIESKNEIIRKINFSLSKVERILYFSLTWNSFEHEIFAFRFDLISTSLFDFIEMTWRNIIIVIFAFSKFELIETFAKIVATSSKWRLLLKFFS